MGVMLNTYWDSRSIETLLVDFETRGGEIATDYLKNIPNDVRIYCPRQLAKGFLKVGVLEGIAWNGVVVQLIGAGKRITVIPDEVCELHCLIQWKDCLEHFGATPTSVVGASLSLLRATLTRTLYVSRGDTPPIPFVVGGRIEQAVSRGWYADCEVWDLEAAYAQTLANLRCDGIWRRSRRVAMDSPGGNFGRSTFVVATITLPELRWGPLPDHEQGDKVRSWIFLQATRSYPKSGTIHGLWSLDEIQAADEVGAKIKVEEVYTLYASSWEPFREWWEAGKLGRKMAGNAGKLMKMTLNTLWGAFAMSGSQSAVRYRNRKRESVPLSFRMPPYRKAYDIAELVTANVRARVYSELMIPAGNDLISVSTDGGLTFPGFEPKGQGWRKKDSGKLLCFVAPYAYAYKQVETGRPIYKCAGVPKHLRRRAFEAMAKDARIWKSENGTYDRAKALTYFNLFFKGEVKEESREWFPAYLEG